MGECVSMLDTSEILGAVPLPSKRGLLSGFALPIGAASMAMLAPNQAIAQSDQADAAKSKGYSAGLQEPEEVVVTARRKSENLQNVPSAITAFTALDLQERQVLTEADLQRVTPG